VAILGTNCSITQIRLLQKLRKKIVLFLDGDKAGKEASVNVIINLLFNEIDCESVKPNYQGDPDEICRQYNKEIIDKIIHTRQNPYLFVLEYYYDNLEIGENPQRIVHFINKIAQLFKKFKQNIKHFLIEKISLLTR
jgi:DNA primase